MLQAEFPNKPNDFTLKYVFSKLWANECIIFVGDLIYRNTKLPTRVTIAKKLAKLFPCPEKTDYLPKVAQFYIDEFSRNELIDNIRNIVQSKARSPLAIHKAIIDLPSNVLASINYDDLLEQACQPGTYTPVVTDIDTAYLRQDRKIIFRLHGALDRAETLIVTEDDYYLFSNYERLGEVLRSYITIRTPIFIGCDLEDHILKNFYLGVSRSLGAHARRAFAVQEEVPTHMSNYWNKNNLTFIRMAPEAFVREALEYTPVIKDKPLIKRAKTKRNTRARKEVFKFLAYFEEADADIFYGRYEDVQRLMNKIAYSQLTILYSQSGLGKTSLIKAGIIPSLRNEGFITIYTRSWYPLIPELNTELHRESRRGGSFAEIVKIGQSLPSTLEKLSEKGHKLVIFADQFEEFFISTSMTDSQRQAFIDLLQYCASGRASNIHFVVSIREDFFAEMHDIQQKLQTNYANLYRLRSLTKEQAIEAITGPSEQIGLEFSEELVQHILSELSEGSPNIYPPQLQIVCYKLCSNLPTNQQHAGLSDLVVLGSVQSILANYVNEVLSLFSGDEQEIAKAALKALVTSQKTKIKLDESALVKRLSARAPRREVRKILRLLEQHRLIRKEEKQGHYYYELTHEYIIGEISNWISKEEFATRRAQEFVDQEYYNWSQDPISYMSIERFSLINEERKRIEIGNDQREFLLMTAVERSLELEYWLHQIKSPTQGLLSNLLNRLEIASGQVKRNAAVALAYLSTEGVILDRVLQMFSEVGNPHTLHLLSKLGIYRLFVNRARDVIAKRFVRHMVKVEAGPFIMGSTNTEIDWIVKHFEIPRGWVSKEMPQSTIGVEGFYIDAFQITNEEFQEFDPSYQFQLGKEKHPAVHVDWLMANKYAAWVGKQLPTEAEWEKAARGTDGRRFPWGNEFDIKKANSKETGIGSTTAVGSYPEGISPYGCYDMAGNVFEWTSSLVAPYPYQMNDGREEVRTSGIRIMRGGAFSYNYSLLRCALRYDYYAPEHSASSLGFRCVVKGSLDNYRLFTGDL